MYERPDSAKPEFFAVYTESGGWSVQSYEIVGSNPYDPTDVTVRVVSDEPQYDRSDVAPLPPSADRLPHFRGLEHASRSTIAADAGPLATGEAVSQSFIGPLRRDRPEEAAEFERRYSKLQAKPGGYPPAPAAATEQPRGRGFNRHGYPRTQMMPSDRPALDEDARKTWEHPQQ